MISLYTLSPTGIITSLNPSFEQITGWSRDTWIGKHFTQLIHPDDIPSATELFQRSLHGETDISCELRVLAKDNRYVIGEFTITNPIQRERELLGIAFDITERKKTEEQLTMLMEELHTEKEFSDAIFNNTSSGIMVLDREGNVLKINHSGAEILKADHEEISGKNITAVYPETKEMLTIDMMVGREVAISLHDGKKRPIGFNSSALFDNVGVNKGVIVVFRDLTEIKELQDEVRRKQHFEAMGKVMSGVAHEIRNPLFAIQSIAQILEREIEIPQHEALIKAILKETSRMRHLVDELLLYGRPSKLNLTDVDLGTVVTELKQYAKTRKPDVPLSFSIPPLTVIRADRDKLMQVFLNLINNALDAGSKTITVAVTRRNAHITVSLIDDGTGIKGQDLERIFDPFYTTKREGTGLGLSICKKIIEDHGGSIEVQSGEGQGTTVTLTLREH
jgi:two-component system sensor histidine kinase HydH